MGSPSTEDQMESEQTAETLAGSTNEQTSTLPMRPLGAESGSVSPGAIIGRYVVLSKLGAGAMGVVLAAYDPELDRKVALKLLKARPGPQDAARARLRREAQALAKLAHPNVVGVHDVGVHDGQLFVGMEFVKGQTLREWMAAVDKPRPWPEVLRVFTEAGRGLAAAHEAGLVHRDFKPDNVMLGEDGRVRVMDFGLVREGEEQSESSFQSVRQSNQQQLDLTRTGAMLGTPAYMSLEQFEARDVDGRSDQFGFCVALYEALHGERPFAAVDLAGLLQAVQEGRIRKPLEGTKVPAWLRKVVVRGLSADRDARWPSMNALLDALADDPAARRRKWWAATLVAGLVAGGGWAMWNSVQQDAETCAGLEAKLDGVWDVERRAAVQTAIEATQLSYAVGTWERVEQRLDEYTQQWVRARVEACEATHRGEQSGELLDSRMACLDERLSHVRATVEVLASADETVVKKAVEAVAGLPSLDFCSDVDALTAEIPPPEDPEVARRVAELDQRLIEARALEKTGKFDAGVELVEPVVREARTLGYEPLQARAWLRQGALQDKAGAYDLAESSLEQAYEKAMGSRMTVEAAQASSLLLFVVGYRLARHDEGRRWAKDAKPLAHAVGTDEAWAGYLSHMGTLADAEGKYDEARGHYEQAFALREKALGPEHPSVGYSLNNLAIVAYTQGEFEEAYGYNERALATFEKVLGSEHPAVAGAVMGMAGARMGQGNYQEARRYFERSLALFERALSPDHPELAYVLNNLGALAEAEGKYEEARVHHERAMAIREKGLGPEHPFIADSLNNLALVALAEGNHEMALDYSKRALAITEKLGPDHPDVASSLDNLGHVARLQGKYEDAVAYHERAFAIREKALGADHPSLVFSGTYVGEALLDLDKPADALVYLERALSVRPVDEVDPSSLASVRFALARALWAAPPDAGQDRIRARELAELARDTRADEGEKSATKLDEVENWLAEHTEQ